MNDTDESRSRIVITKADLIDPRIDQAILSGQSFGARVAESSQQKSRYSVFYSSWFYLMLAGAIGAFTAWALIEPKFNDGINFTAKVESIEPDATRPPIPSDLVRGRFKMAGTTVYMLPGKTRFFGQGATEQPLSINDLQAGQPVRLMAESIEDFLIARAVWVEPEGTPVVSSINVSNLNAERQLYGFILFPLVAGLVGLMVGSVEGIICRNFPRALWCGSIGLVVGLIIGAISLVLGGLVIYGIGMVTGGLDPQASAGAFLVQMFKRGLGWAIAGIGMGLGQGIALKSRKLALNGIIGGIVGGLIGGVLFDPINLLIAGKDLLSGAEVSRAIGLTIIGGTAGLMIGLTELLTRNAWIKVLQGPLRGKEFTFTTTPIRLGSSPKNEIYLFKDSKIAPLHAEINKLRDAYEIVDKNSVTGTFVNGRQISRYKLSDGDVIKLGDAEFSYATKEKKESQ